MKPNVKSWLPEGVTQGDLDDSDFAWISDRYKAGDESKSEGRKFPFQLHGKENEAGWRAAWSRAHQVDDSSFEGGPSRDDVYKTLMDNKPAGVEVADDGKSLTDPETEGKSFTPAPKPEAPAVHIKTDPDPLPSPPAGLQFKTVAFKLGGDSSSSLGPDEFEGYASTWDLDEGGEFIQPGAFAAQLDFFKQHGKMCWQHDWCTPIGKNLQVREDDRGLYVRGRVSQTTTGKDALILMRDGVIDSLSIGYEVLSSKTLSDEEGIALFGEARYLSALRSLPWYADGITQLTSLKLYEYSPVTFPMNLAATITGIKGQPLTGLTLDAHFSTVHDAVTEMISRYKGLAALRAKEGRMLSETNRQRLADMKNSLSEHIGTLDDLLAASAAARPFEQTPEPDADQFGGASDGDADEGKAARALAARKEYLRFLKLQAQQLGVAV